MSTRAGRAFPRPLVAAAFACLVVGLWAGLLRIGWAIPVLDPRLVGAHGPLMVCGFLGTVIGLERAVALGRAPAAVGPVASLASAVAFVAGAPAVAAGLALLAALALLVTTVVLVARAPSLAGALTALGAAAWLAAGALWGGFAWPVSRVVPLWIAFLVCTIAGERLELARLAPATPAAQRLLVAALALLLAGVAVWSLSSVTLVAAAGLLAVAVWLLRNDVARRTIRGRGLPRYIAAALLAGHAWLAVAALLVARLGAIDTAGPAYDAALHAVFVGFVFSMIFGHAPTILPAVAKVVIPYRRAFWGPLALLHGALALRVAGDLAGAAAARSWGGMLGAVAIASFLVLTLGTAVASARRGRRLAPSPAR